MAPAPVELAGGPVVLSAPVAADVDRIAEFCRDPEVAAWTTVPSPYGHADAVRFVTGTVPDGWAGGHECVWAVRDATTGLLHGVIGLHHIHDGEGEIGFWLSAGARGRGWMATAVGLVLDYAFDGATGLGLERVVWHAYAGNAASAAVARRAGFRWEGVARLGAPHRGVRRDDWQAALLADDPRSPVADWPAFTFVQGAE